MHARLERQMIAASALAACLWFGVGCENNSDVGGDEGEPSNAHFFITPSQVTLESFETDAVLTVSGGAAPFAWTFSEPRLGIITGLNADGSTESREVNYKRVGTERGVNTVRVQDSNGNTATATVDTRSDPTILVSPILVTLGPGDASATFTVSGGWSPYLWSVSENRLGRITFADGASAVYTREPGLAGVNIIRVRDLEGFGAEATVQQTL